MGKLRTGRQDFFSAASQGTSPSSRLARVCWRLSIDRRTANRCRVARLALLLFDQARPLGH